MTPAPQRRERKAQCTPTGNEETAPPTARRNRTAGGAERTHPSGRPRRGDRESPPPRSGSGRKGWQRGGSRGATEGAAQNEGNGAARASRSAERPRPTEPKGAEKRARERQARARGTSACAALAERRTRALMERLGGARGAATPQPRSGRAARDPRRSGGGWHKGAREKAPVGLFRARQNERPPERQRAHREVPRGRRRAVAVGYTRRRYRPQRGRLGGGQSTAAAVHEMSRTAQPLVQSLTGREPSPIINHGGSSASAGACQPVFPLGAVRRHPAPVRGL